MSIESLDNIEDRVKFITNHLLEHDSVDPEFIESFTLELEEIKDELKKIKNENNNN